MRTPGGATLIIAGLTVAGLTVAGLTACGNDLDTRPQDVRDLRILAICADHPETFVVAETQSVGSIGLAGLAGLSGWPYSVTEAPPAVSLTALVVDPEHTRRVFEASALACVAGTNVRCDEGAPGTQRLFERRATSAGVQRFTFEPSAETLNAFIAEDAYRGYGSLYVMIDLTLQAPDGETLRATKILTYTRPGVTPAEDQPPPPPPTVNTNPATWVLASADTGPDAGQTLSSGPMGQFPADRTDPTTLTFAPGERWKTRITLSGADPEYAVPRFPTGSDTNPGYELLEEQLFLDFYALAGRWDTKSVSNRNLFGEVEELEATYVAPESAADFPTTLYLVSSDDRGGCAWGKVEVTRAEDTR